MKRHFISALVMAAVAAGGPAGRAAADGGDFAAGLIIGGIAGAVINNEANKNKRRTVRTSSSSRKAPVVDTAQRAENREVQSALNYFGFDAGSPDGVFGNRTRGAVSGFQRHLGYPVTGQLTQFEKDFLLSSYTRAQAGGSLTLQQIAATPGGAGGLLLTWRDELAGGPGTVLATVPATPVAPVIVPAAPPPGTGTLAAAEPQVPAGQAGFAALPTFLTGNVAQASLTSHCNKVSLLTNTNGGFTTLASMGDPDTTLNEQFCLARTYAIASGEELAGKVQGVTSAQMETQCKAFGTVMADPVAALAVDPAAAVLTQAAGVARDAGMPAAQLAGTAKICLSVGYRTDDMATALGSALLLTALGEQVYGELIGHHLMMGFGASKRPDLSEDWYRLGLTALAGGQAAVFAPGQPERAALIEAAVFGAPAASPVVPAAEVAPEAPKPKLKGFSISN